jgi:hypothetical protein
MSGGIYLIQDGGRLVELREQPYDSEDLLQQLLARYPNLLAGDQMDPAAPRRWLLVKREKEVPSEEGGSGRWAVDHLFLDQDAVPTLVEVKRSNDTRIRREVIGQMLDYAANAVAYWPVETLRAQFETACEETRSPDEVFQEFVGPDADEEQFWQQAKTNLQAGKIRLVFVADVIPLELKRVVEFLNSQMDPAEVLAVELKQYVGQGLKTLVPRVIGQTAEAQQKKAPGSMAKQWDEASFFQKLESRRGPKEAAVGRQIFGWAKNEGLRIWWGKGRIDGSFYPMIDCRGDTFYTVGVWTYGTIEIPFQMMQTKALFNDEAKRLELLRRLNELPGVSIPQQAITKRPSIRLHLLQDAKVLAQFIDLLAWICEQVRETQQIPSG